MRTLTIASAASAAAAAVTSQLWIAGTWIAAALTPVLVTLISEALHRPTERVARATRARSSERSARGGTAARAAAEPGPVRIYRSGGGSRRPRRRKIAIGVVAATAALAMAVAVATITTVDLVTGGSVGRGSGGSTFWGGSKANRDSDTQRQERAPSTDEEQTDQPAERQPTRPETEEPPPSEPPADEQPSDTAPVPTTPVPGEPAPQAVP